MPNKKISKKFNYSLDLIQSLILNVDDYHNFLPWCSYSKIKSKDENENEIIMIADLEIGYSFAKDTYTSHIIFNKRDRTINVTAIDGPLKSLENKWKLINIGNGKCEVNFFISLELKNFLLNKMLSSMFEIGFNKILKSFEDRAEYLHNLNR